MTKAYTNADAVAKYMGQTFTADQVTLSTTYIDYAVRFIDRLTRRGDPLTGAAGWLNTAITDEQYELLGGYQLFLRCVPVTSVESVKIRSHIVGDTDTVLTAGTNYELQDPLRGLIAFSTSYGRPIFYDSYTAHHRIGFGSSTPYSFAKISYTPNQPVPDDITQATNQLVAHWLTYNINPQQFGLTEVKTASQMYKFASQNGQVVLPAEAMAIICGYERLIF